MTVAELIAKLQALPQDLPVASYDDDGLIVEVAADPRHAEFYEGGPEEGRRVFLDFQHRGSKQVAVVAINVAP